MIKSLTCDQRAKLPEWAAKWIAIVLSTEPADRPRAEAAIRRMYRDAGLALPKIVWCGSPLGNILTHMVVIGNSHTNSVNQSVGASVKASVRASVGDSVRESMWDIRMNSIYGQYDGPWLASFDYYRTVCGLTKETEPLIGLLELAQSVGWALPYKNICWVSERHSVVQRDTQGRLHCPDGPAMLYPDGWSIYAWHGVLVSREVIHGEYVAQEILGQSNAEVKRVMIERMGLESFFRQLQPEVVHEDIDGYGNPRRLLQIDLPEARNGVLRAVMVQCPSTGREYILGVPSSVQTCQAAVASTFGIKPNEYHPVVET